MVRGAKTTFNWLYEDAREVGLGREVFSSRCRGAFGVVERRFGISGEERRGSLRKIVRR